MKVKLKGDHIRFTAESIDECDWIRSASKFNFLQVHQASVGAPPNYIELHAASGFHAYELTSLLSQVNKKLEGISAAFRPKDTEK